MNTLVMLLLFIFAGVALMVIIGERHAKPMEPEKMQRIARWILPLCFLAALIQTFRYFME